MQTQSTEKKVIPFTRLQRLGLLISALFIVFSFYSMYDRGFNFGVDFQGGYKLVYKFGGPLTEGEIRKALESLELGDAQVVIYGKPEDHSYLVKAKYVEGGTTSAVITEVIQQQLGGTSVELQSEEMVGPRVGAELRKKGTFAVALAWILITIYVSWRFSLQFAPGALIALIHDVVITIGFFTFFGKEVNLPILAAALTIIGYSINDTIVIYDRIRENLKKLPTSIPLGEIVDRSLTETLSRTIVTSLTVLFAVVVLFILGGGVLKDFAFCMIVGVIVGSYSSLFVATPFYLLCQRLFPNRGIKRD